MAKKNVSKNIIKAMSIGLSLMLANQPILSMAATEGENSNSGNENTITIPQEDSSIVGEAKDKSEETSDVLDVAEGIAEEALGLAEDVSSSSVIEAAADFEKEVESDTKQNIDTPSIDISQNDVALDLMDTYNELAEQKAEAADEQAQITADKTTEAQNLADEADEVIENANKAIKDAQKVLDESKTTIANAKDTDTANKGYSNAETAVKDASDVVDKAETKLGEIQNDFEEIENAYGEAVTAFGELTGEYETAEGLFDDAKSTALAEEANAGSRIDVIAASAGALQAAANQAKQALENSGFFDIIKLEEGVQELLDNGKSVEFVNDGVSFANLFNAIVKNYYVPNMLNGEFVSADWHRFSGSYTYDNNNVVSTQGDVLNYCVVTYKDSEGEEQQKILNYKVTNGNKTNDKNWPGIVIFEKTAHDDEYRNDNWYTGKVVLVTQDKEKGMDYKTDGKQPYDKNDMILDEEETKATAAFRQTIKEAQDLVAKYQSIADKAEAAQKKYQEANTKVGELIEIVNGINSTATITKGITEFDSNIELQLSQAIENLEEVKKDRDNLVKELDELKDQLNKKIDELTKKDPEPAPVQEEIKVVEEEKIEVVSTTPIIQNKVAAVIVEPNAIEMESVPAEVEEVESIEIEDTKTALIDSLGEDDEEDTIYPDEEIEKGMSDKEYYLSLFCFLLLLLILLAIYLKYKEEQEKLQEK